MRLLLFMLLLLCASFLAVHGGGTPSSTGSSSIVGSENITSGSNETNTGNNNSGSNETNTGNNNNNNNSGSNTTTSGNVTTPTTPAQLTFTVVSENDTTVTLSADTNALLAANIFGISNRPGTTLSLEATNNPDVVCFARTAAQAEYNLWVAYSQLLNSSFVSSDPQMQAIIRTVLNNKQAMVARDVALYTLLTGNNLTVQKESLISLPLTGASGSSGVSGGGNSGNSGSSGSNTAAARETNTALVNLIERELDLAGLYNMAYVSTSNPIAQYVFFLGEHETVR